MSQRTEELCRLLNEYEAINTAQTRKRNELLATAKARGVELYENIRNWLHPVGQKVICTISRGSEPLQFEGLNVPSDMLTIEIAGKLVTFEARIKDGQLEHKVTGLDRARTYVVVEDANDHRPIYDAQGALIEHFTEDYLFRKLITLIDLAGTPARPAN